MKSGPLSSTHDLLPSELRLTAAMQKLGYGRYESIPIHDGELQLEPWPTTVKDVKFGASNCDLSMEPTADFRLKKQVTELFGYIRSVKAGTIRVLQVMGGLPFLMQVEHRQVESGDGSE